MDTSTFCNSTSTSAPVKLGLRLLDRCSLCHDFESEVAFALPVECAQVAIACPYKELAGRFCMQVQLRTHFQAVMNPAEIFSEVGLSRLVRRYLIRHLRKCSRMRSIVSSQLSVFNY